MEILEKRCDKFRFFNRLTNKNFLFAQWREYRPPQSSAVTLLMQSSFRKSLAAWSVLITAILSIVGVLVYRSIIGLLEDTAWVTHTHVVIETLSETLSQMKDVEAGQRGYIITGESKYLAPYRAALPALKQNLAKLKSLTADNEIQQERLIPLGKIIQSRIAIAQTTIDMRDKRGFAAAQKIVLTDIGRQEMNAIRARIARMEDEEKNLLSKRSKQAQNAAQLALNVCAGGLLIVVFIILGMLNLVRRESARRMEVEAGLETANSQLQNTLAVMERLTREMTLTSTFAEMLQSCHTTEEAYNVIGSTLPQVFPHSTSVLGLINASQNLVEIVLQIPENQDAKTPLFSPNECWALRRGHAHLVPDAAAGVLCPHLVKHQAQRGATLCLPLMAHGETLGVLTIFSGPTQPFSEADQRAAFAIAEHVSLALANLKLQETLRTQSIRDPLSGLFNRRYLEASVEREIARAQRHKTPLGVLMIDIDFFKKFNDDFGHEAGDELLKAFGNFLQKQSRGEDIACRYGGEEFTIILPEASLEAAQSRAEQLRAGAAQLQVEYRRQRLPEITISTGVAAFPIHGETKEELMRAADAALYRAKREGRDRVVVAEV